ncbi:MOSC domain-containing protein [Candidatus Peregrinibacteria bacterium]|nr:MOSC domain-containing protein [Candidatus Peregrinibacteria bacterium]
MSSFNLLRLMPSSSILHRPRTLPDKDHGSEEREHRRITLVAAIIYHVKSCAGQVFDKRGQQVMMTPKGLAYDRRRMLVRTDDLKMLTQRDNGCEILALVQTAIRNGMLVLNAPHMPELEIPLQKPEGLPLETKVGKKDTATVIADAPEASAWFTSYLGQDCLLVHEDERAYGKHAWHRTGQNASLADGSAALGVSAETVEEDLAAHMRAEGDEPLEVSDVRPNLVFRGGGKFAEYGMDRIQIDDAELLGVGPSPRCKMTIVDQKKGTRSRKKALKIITNVYPNGKGEGVVGENFLVDVPGIIRIGSDVLVRQEKPKPYAWMR